MINAKYTLTGEVNVATQYIQPNLEEGKVTPTKEEQVIMPNENYNGFSKVTVDPIPNEYIIPNGNLDIKANGEYDVTENASVNVDVQPNLQDKTIEVKPLENKNITADEGFNGLGVVNVIGTIDTETKEVTPTKEVQTITRSDNKYIESVTVNAIPDNYIEPSGEMEITENGSYDVTDKASVKVETSGADLSEYFGGEIVGASGSMYNTPTWQKGVKKLPALKNSGTLKHLYFQCYATEIDLSGLDFSLSDTMESMFSNCKEIESIDLSQFDTSTITNMKQLFYQCDNLKNINIKGIDTSKVENFSSMFGSCKSLVSLDISEINTENVTDMGSCFSGCKNLTSLDLSSFNTSNVTSMASMFNGCTSLTHLDLSNFNTSNVTNMYYMFNNCTKLTSLDIRNFDFTKVTNYSGMFGSGTTTYIPANCLIIVKDDTAKEWITSKFSRLTNVKTVAELGE